MSEKEDCGIEFQTGLEQRASGEGSRLHGHVKGVSRKSRLRAGEGLPGSQPKLAGWLRLSEGEAIAEHHR